MDEIENTASSPDEKTPLTPYLPQIAQLRLKPTKSTDSLTHHPLLNNEEESDTFSLWSSQQSRRSSSTSSSSSLQPRNSTLPVPGGSVGGLLLTKLREMNTDFSDIVHMLKTKKATLLLPASQVMPFENIDRVFLKDHVVYSQSTEGGTKVITLNGVKGFIQQDVFKAVGLVPTDQFDIESPKSCKSIFDAFSKPTDFSYGYPSINIVDNYPDIILHGKPIQTIVIESPVRTKEIAERIATYTEMKNSLPELLLEEIHNFTRDFIKSPPKDENSSIDQIQGLFDSVRYGIEDQIEPNGELTEANEDDINEAMNIVERYVCTALHDDIFSPKWSSDSTDDEALGSRIASLNLLELGLSNFGVDIKPQQQERIDFAVQEAGAELQNLEQKKSPHEKLDSLVQCHRIVVEALKKRTKTRHPSSSDSADNTTSALSQNSYVTSPPADVSPASIPLPPSPPSPNILTSQKLSMSPPTSPTEGSSNPNADAIFPLLIFTVVKSNPKKLISNLRFMLRYRVRNLLCGESSYCLTNILAAVQFLESAESLGMSDNALNESINVGPSLEERTRKVGQEIVVVADNSIKALTGVMDSSVKMFGRLIGYNESASTGANPSISNTDAGQLFTNSMNDIRKNPGLPEKGVAKELAEINTTKNNIKNIEPSNTNEEIKSLTGRLISFNVLPRFSNGRNNIDEEENKGQKVNNTVNKISPPIQKFLDCPIDEFRVNDVPALLEDYKRLANAVRDLGLFSS